MEVSGPDFDCVGSVGDEVSQEESGVPRSEDAEGGVQDVKCV